MQLSKTVDELLVRLAVAKVAIILLLSKQYADNDYFECLTLRAASWVFITGKVPSSFLVTEKARVRRGVGVCHLLSWYVGLCLP